VCPRANRHCWGKKGLKKQRRKIGTLAEKRGANAKKKQERSPKKKEFSPKLPPRKEGRDRKGVGSHRLQPISEVSWKKKKPQEGGGEEKRACWEIRESERPGKAKKNPRKKKKKKQRKRKPGKGSRCYSPLEVTCWGGFGSEKQGTNRKKKGVKTTGNENKRFSFQSVKLSRTEIKGSVYLEEEKGGETCWTQGERGEHRGSVFVNYRKKGGPRGSSSSAP